MGLLPKDRRLARAPCPPNGHFLSGVRAPHPFLLAAACPSLPDSQFPGLNGGVAVMSIYPACRRPRVLFPTWEKSPKWLVICPRDQRNGALPAPVRLSLSQAQGHGPLAEPPHLRLQTTGSPRPHQATALGLFFPKSPLQPLTPASCHHEDTAPPPHVYVLCARVVSCLDCEPLGRDSLHTCSVCTPGCANKCPSSELWHPVSWGSSRTGG